MPSPACPVVVLVLSTDCFAAPQLDGAKAAGTTGSSSRLPEHASHIANERGQSSGQCSRTVQHQASKTAGHPAVQSRPPPLPSAQYTLKWHHSLKTTTWNAQLSYHRVDKSHVVNGRSFGAGRGGINGVVAVPERTGSFTTVLSGRSVRACNEVYIGSEWLERPSGAGWQRQIMGRGGWENDRLPRKRLTPTTAVCGKVKTAEATSSGGAGLHHWVAGLGNRWHGAWGEWSRNFGLSGTGVV